MCLKATYNVKIDTLFNFVRKLGYCGVCWPKGWIQRYRIWGCRTCGTWRFVVGLVWTFREDRDTFICIFFCGILCDARILKKAGHGW